MNPSVPVVERSKSRSRDRRSKSRDKRPEEPSSRGRDRRPRSAKRLPTRNVTTQEVYDKISELQAMLSQMRGEHNARMALTDEPCSEQPVPVPRVTPPSKRSEQKSTPDPIGKTHVFALSIGRTTLPFSRISFGISVWMGLNPVGFG